MAETLHDNSHQPSSDLSIRRLIDMLKSSEDHSDEWFAARTDLLRLGADLILDPLITLLRDPAENDRDRCLAAGILGELHNARAATPLSTRALDKDASPKVRYCCIWSLEYPGGAQAENTLSSIFLDVDEDLDIRKAALMSFPPACTSTGMDSLLVALRDEVNEVRSEAVRAITRALWCGKDGRVLAPLVEALTDTEPTVRFGAAEALLSLGDNQAVEPLVARLLDVQERTHVRGAAAEALGDLRDARAVEPLLAVLNSGGHYFREQVANALSKIGDTRAVEPLVSLLNDQNQHKDVRLSAARAVGMLGDVRGIDYLAEIATTQQNESELRCAAISCLEDVHDGRATQALLAVLNDEDTDVRYEAVCALGESDDMMAVPVLARLLREDESWEVRSTAAEGLSKLGSPVAIPQLLSALKDDEDMVRGKAATSLGVLGGVEMFDRLLTILNDKNEDGYTRSCAADGLAAIGDKRAIEPLLEALQEEDAFVLYGAAEALGKLGDLSVLPALEEAYERVKYRSWADERVADSIAEIKERLGSMP